VVGLKSNVVPPVTDHSTEQLWLSGVLVEAKLYSLLGHRNDPELLLIVLGWALATLDSSIPSSRAGKKCINVVLM
jgi:uncharacterized protein (DUF486 family)